MAGNIRCMHAVVHQVVGSPVLEASMNYDSEVIPDMLRNVQPV